MTEITPPFIRRPVKSHVYAGNQKWVHGWKMQITDIHGRPMFAWPQGAPLKTKKVLMELWKGKPTDFKLPSDATVSYRDHFTISRVLMQEVDKLFTAEELEKCKQQLLLVQ